jgi:hypothetical protein
MKIAAVAISILFGCISASNGPTQTASRANKRKNQDTSFEPKPTKRIAKKSNCIQENVDEQIKKLKAKFDENNKTFKQSFSKEQFESIDNDFAFIPELKNDFRSQNSNKLYNLIFEFVPI